ncbi:MAG: dihydroneopterin aldolase [Deltaproteobacteria bacterium]|nr:dihydroneopterin aldolase [Deltaproteobacteria bacterium]
MDRVQVIGLSVDALIGVGDHERHARQRLEIDVEARTSLVQAGLTDDLECTVDYDRLARICRDVALERHHRLIETVGEKIAAKVLSSWSCVQAVKVRVEKPGVVAGARTVAIQILRRRATGRGSSEGAS